jgi:peptide/nickel transport system substrate-binding protein
MQRRLWLSIAVAAIGTGLLVAATATAAPSKATAPAGKVVKKGGTLVVELSTDLDYVDPQLTYYAPSWELQYATACKLFNFPDKEAPAGSQLQPEVAAGLPVVSNNGKTYTFKIRSGFKFSNGEAVTAQSFKRSVERLANPKMASQGSPFLADIVVGAQARIDGKAASVSGVTAKGNTLTIKLLHAAPDLLSRLAMPFFQAIDSKLAATIDDKGVNAYASCGPYYVASRTPNRAITIKRNTFYKGPRPHNLNTIQVNVGNTLDVVYQNVLKATSDYAADGIPPAQWADIAKRFGINKSQFYTRPQLELDYVALNHDRPLFKNNTKLAKALNYAIDRQAYLAQRGYLAGKRSDQILPPGMPGYKDFSVYPLKVTSGTQAQAKKLAAGNTRDGQAIVWAANRGANPLQAQIVQFNLKQLGIDSEIKLLPRSQQFGDAKIRGAKYDVDLEAWGADYADPYDFINILLDGNSIGPAGNNNYSYYNNAKFNKQMTQAALLAGSARTNAYAALDKAIMAEDPPWVSILNRNNRLFVSSRVGCFVYNPVYETSYASLCLK